MMKFQLACPVCQIALQIVDELHLHCAGDDLTFVSEDGIWRMLKPDRERALSGFITTYEALRSAEQYGSDDPAYFRLLPFHDLSQHYQTDWHDRGERYLRFLAEVLQPYERSHGGLLTVLDIGAGNAWMSGRLAGRGHAVAAIDVLTNRWDGLGAHVAYGDGFLPVQAEFDALPFEDRTIEAVILNASFHYSMDFKASLQESLRVLKPGSLLAILDTPVFQDVRLGEQVLAERQPHLAQIADLPTDTPPLEQVLTFDHLNALERDLGITWSLSWPLSVGRRILRRLQGEQPPAHFPAVYTYKP